MALEYEKGRSGVSKTTSSSIDCNLHGKLY